MWRVWSGVAADCCSGNENSLRTGWSWTWENKKVGADTKQSIIIFSQDAGEHGAVVYTLLYMLVMKSLSYNKQFG